MLIKGFTPLSTTFPENFVAHTDTNKAPFPIFSVQYFNLPSAERLAQILSRIVNGYLKPEEGYKPDDLAILIEQELWDVGNDAEIHSIFSSEEAIKKMVRTACNEIVSPHFNWDVQGQPYASITAGKASRNLMLAYAHDMDPSLNPSLRDVFEEEKDEELAKEAVFVGSVEFPLRTDRRIRKDPGVLLGYFADDEGDTFTAITQAAYPFLYFNFHAYPLNRLFPRGENYFYRKTLVRVVKGILEDNSLTPSTDEQHDPYVLSFPFQEFQIN